MAGYFLIDMYDKEVYDLSALVGENPITAVIVGNNPRQSPDIFSITPLTSLDRYLEEEHFNLVPSPEFLGLNNICLRDTSKLFGVTLIRKGHIVNIDLSRGNVLFNGDYILPVDLTSRGHLYKSKPKPFLFKSE